ncbi:MAG TPA: redoxin domain-containing protein [Pirellulales bacterium]
MREAVSRQPSYNCCNGVAAALALLAFAVLPPFSPAADGPAAPAKLSDGWSTTVALPPYSWPNNDSPSGACRAWVEQGWLLVERRTDRDELEWKIVLAKVVGDEPPQIDVHRPGSLRLDYRGGLYFIRDEFGNLRCRRQTKTPDDVWPDIALPGRDPDGDLWGSAGGGKLVGTLVKPWFFVAAGPKQGAADCLLRLNHQELRTGGTSFSGGQVINRITDGETNVMDDGELLIAERVEEWSARAAVERVEIQKTIRGSTAPKLTGAWFNTGGESLDWKDLKGNAVLLVFFNLSDSPSFSERLPALKQLHSKFYEKGLVIVGVQTQQDAKHGARLVEKHHLDFPVLIDSFETLRRFGIDDLPSYFLIDRQGKVAWNHLSSPPPAAEIEKLLGD